MIDTGKVAAWKSHAMTTDEFVRMNTNGLHFRGVYVVKMDAPSLLIE
jgi:hypothetical protein